jgi:hypothetical protein
MVGSNPICGMLASMWLAGQDMLCLNNWWCQCLMLVLQPIADDTRKLKDLN